MSSSRATKLDGFSEKFQTALDPPHFRKIILHFSENPCAKVQYVIFCIENDPPPPIVTFSKIHPFWYRHPSQSRVKQLYFITSVSEAKKSTQTLKSPLRAFNETFQL